MSPRACFYFEIHFNIEIEYFNYKIKVAVGDVGARDCMVMIKKEEGGHKGSGLLTIFFLFTEEDVLSVK